MLLQLSVLWCYNFDPFIVHVCEASSTFLNSKQRVFSNAGVVAGLVAAYKWTPNLNFSKHYSKQ